MNCPYDTNGDGDCGRLLCPHCGEPSKRGWKGPRNLPKPNDRKRRRNEVKKSRKQNRGVYSGQ